jgi:hypothetical protein
VSRGDGRRERQILAILEADQGAHLCVRLETLVYTVAGCISNLGEDYDPWEASKPVCDCQPYYLPGSHGHRLYDHTPACYPLPSPPTDAVIKATQWAVRSLVRKGKLQSARVGQRTSTSYVRTHPCRMTYVWRAETPIEALYDYVRIAWRAQAWSRELSVAHVHGQHL